jgi:endonuclease/exonuclease/phosphatase family metal-dependent hydrolase
VKILHWFLCLSVIGFSSARSEDPIRVMTYNIRYLNPGDGPDHWDQRSEAVAETMRQADIIGLQEATALQIERLETAIEAFDWYGVGRDDGERSGEFCPIFWRRDSLQAVDRGTFWLGPDPEAVGKPAWEANLPRICSWVVFQPAGTNTRLLVMNTHFDHQSQLARLNSAALIRQQAEMIANREPMLGGVILMGDLNCQESSPPLRTLTDAAAEGMTFTDSRSLVDAPSGPDGTWNGFREIQPGRRIDFILMGKPQVEVLNHQTLDPKTSAGRFASDHLPVMITIP